VTLLFIFWNWECVFFFSKATRWIREIFLTLIHFNLHWKTLHPAFNRRNIMTIVINSIFFLFFHSSSFVHASLFPRNKAGLACVLFLHELYFINLKMDYGWWKFYSKNCGKFFWAQCKNFTRKFLTATEKSQKNLWRQCPCLLQVKIHLTSVLKSILKLDEFLSGVNMVIDVITKWNFFSFFGNVMVFLDEFFALCLKNFPHFLQ